MAAENPKVGSIYRKKNHSTFTVVLHGYANAYDLDAGWLVMFYHLHDEKIDPELRSIYVTEQDTFFENFVLIGCSVSCECCLKRALEA